MKRLASLSLLAALLLVASGPARADDSRDVQEPTDVQVQAPASDVQQPSDAPAVDEVVADDASGETDGATGEERYVPADEPPYDPGQPTKRRLPYLHDADAWYRLPLKIWGHNDAMRKYNIESYFGRFFYARADQVLTHARLILELDDDPHRHLDKEIRALQISLNGEVVASIGRQSLLSGPRRRVIYFDPRLLIDENEYILRWVPYTEGPCQYIVPQGTWTMIKEGFVDTRAAQLPLPNDLGRLPLPFFDQRVDREPAVQIVFLEDPSAASLRAAGLVSSFFGMHAGSGGVRFPITIGEIPDGHAVVLTVTGALDTLDEKGHGGPAIRLMEHPGPGQGNYKLLVLRGRDGAELEIAARHLAEAVWGYGPYKGTIVRFDDAFDSEQAKKRELPSWYVSKREMRLSDILASDDTLTHRGHRGDTLRFEFRIAPELLAEPAESLLLDLEYLQRLPEPFIPTKLDVEFNGIYLMTLPKYEGGLDARPHIQRLTLPRNQLRGVNRVQVHVSALQVPPLCTAESWKLVENTVSEDSMLRLVGEREVELLPDVEAFVYDGLPSTVEPELGDTLLVLPDDVTAAEIGTALSIVSNLSGASGRPSTGLRFLPESQILQVVERDEAGQEASSSTSESEPEGGPDDERPVRREDRFQDPEDRGRHLLLVASADHSRLLRRWSDLLPLSTRTGRMELRPPHRGETMMEFLRARWPREEAERAAQFLLHAEHPSAVLGMESPLQPGRSVVAVTADNMANLPHVVDLQGYTEARLEEGGDLLLIDGEERAVFHVGPTYSDGSMGRLSYLRWLLGGHWLLLYPLLALATVLMALVLRAWLSRRERARLTEGEHEG